LLAVDGSRYQSLQTQMQAAADAAALAGAAELNGQPGAMSRATDAVNNYLSNYLSGMGITNAVQYSSPAYYSALSPANQLPSNGTAATGDADAHFVLVTVTPVTVSTVFPVRYLIPSGTNSFSAGAQAVAGMFEDICGTPPPVIYICNPWEGTPTNLSTALSSPSELRKQLQLINDGTNSPGHFGWIVPPDGDVSASNLQDWIARNGQKTCFRTTVSLNTDTQPLNGFNRRFDIGADSTHSPDVNVRKGYQKTTGNMNFCSPNVGPYSPPPPPPSMKLPPDNTSFTNAFQGNGQWDCGNYWSTEHNTPAPTVNEFGERRVCGTPDTTTFTRYEIYRYEIASNLLTDWSRGQNGNYSNSPINKAGENGQPLCLGAASGVPKRRVLPVPVIDCIANSANMDNGARISVAPADFAKFFITEPVDQKLIGEFTGPLVDNTEVRAFQNVKLYR
jgi:hypothetical protein